MRLGFDLDNIFISTPPIIPYKVIERLYRGKPNGVLRYRYPSKTEQFIRKISHASILRPVIKSNLLFAESLSPDKKHEIFLISSRFGFLKNRTKKLIKKNKLDKIFRELHFNYEDKQPHMFKHELIKKLGIERYVDDDLYLLKYVASKNNSVKLFWLNKKLNKKISNNIQAITNLAELLK